MGKYFDVIDGLKFAWPRFIDLDLLKWSAIFTLGSTAIGWLFGALAAMGGSDLISGASDAVSIVALVLFGFVVLPRVYLAAMSASSIRAKLPSLADYALLSIRLMCVNFLCWYDKKLLAPAVVLLAASAACLLVGIFNNLVLLAFYFFFLTGILAWAVGAIVHTIRTFFATFMLVHGEGPESVLAKKSHDLIKGQTFEVFLAMLAISLIVGIASLPFVFFGMALSSLPYGNILSVALIVLIDWLYLAYRYVFFAKMYAFYADVPFVQHIQPAVGKHAPGQAPKKPIRRSRR